LKPRILLTSDGSTTLRIDELNETYHSVHGAMVEARHVFMAAGLEHEIFPNEIHLLEIGLGTGLNALLSALRADHSEQTIFYTSLEKFPLDAEICDQLIFPGIPPELTADLHRAPWDQPIWLNPFFCLEKKHTDLHDFQTEADRFDLIFYDAFAPDVQPEMWTEECFRKAYDWLCPGGTLVTYCAKGEVRRTMQRAGFSVERLPGPPGKREMLRATKPTIHNDH